MLPPAAGGADHMDGLLIVPRVAAIANGQQHRLAPVTAPGPAGTATRARRGSNQVAEGAEGGPCVHALRCIRLAPRGAGKS